MSHLTKNSLIDAFTNKSAVTKIALDITNGSYDISYFVEQLGFALTSIIVEERVSGTKLLSDVLAELPQDYLNTKQLEFLSTFYADRLKDQHNVLPAVIDGMGVLFMMKNLPKQSVTQLLLSFFQHTICQSQVRTDRAKLFKIFKYLSENYATELRFMGPDFIYGLIISIDGERDPRNLDYIFSFMPNFLANFPLVHLSEEMFEIFACYFPVDFNPTKNDPDNISREKLADKLSNCLTATPDFVEWTIDLALDKLDSDLILAKLDSLHLLLKSAQNFPPKSLEIYFEKIWTALKTEIFPGTDKSEIVQASLKTLHAYLQQVASMPDISHNYQTCILGIILPHLSDVNQRLFEPAINIALVCIATDAKFATAKVLKSFLLKLNEFSTADAAAQAVTTTHAADRIKIFTIITNIFNTAAACKALTEVADDTTTELQSIVIAALRSNEPHIVEQNLELISAALNVLNASVPIINESNRVLVYQALVQLITHDKVDLEFTLLIEQLGALYPIELQSNLIDVCIKNFTIFSNFIKQKIYTNLLPLVKQIAFTQRILELIMTNVFKDALNSDERLLALKALNTLLQNEDERFVVELQNNNDIIEKLVQLAHSVQTDLVVLQQISLALSLIIKHLQIAEQYMIVTMHITNLNLQLAADLYIANGLLSFLHKDISLDEHFENLLNDLTKLSLESENAELREVAHHLLCSLCNKVDYEHSKTNQLAIRKLIDKLKEHMKAKNAKAIEALAWLAKGLAVRGDEDIADIIQAFEELLEDPSLSTVVALAFEILYAECAQLHLPLVKYLFKQKLFHTILKKLGKKLETFCEHHINAFIYVLKGTPHAVLKMNIEKVGPILFKSLEAHRVHTITIALDICDNFIKQQDNYFQTHLQHLIPSYLKLSNYESSMHVRVKALNLLYDISKYPTFLLLPHKTDVVLELAAALDDPKRLVRNAAVKARNAWFLIGAPNTTPD